MQKQELIQKIHDYIKSYYKAEFIGYMDVNKNDSEYIFTIGIPSYSVPTTMTISCETDEEFLNYIYSELRRRNYMRVDMYKVIKQNDSRKE